MFSNNYDNVYPKKVCCCSCLMHLVNQIYSANIRCYTEILQAINKLCQGSSQSNLLSSHGRKNEIYCFVPSTFYNNHDM